MATMELSVCYRDPRESSDLVSQYWWNWSIWLEVLQSKILEVVHTEKRRYRRKRERSISTSLPLVLHITLSFRISPYQIEKICSMEASEIWSQFEVLVQVGPSRISWADCWKERSSGSLKSDIAINRCDSLVFRSDCVQKTGVERRALSRILRIQCCYCLEVLIW